MSDVRSVPASYCDCEGPAHVGPCPVSEIIHHCPPDGEGVMPCCDRTPFQVSSRDRMTLDASLVTCE